MVEEEKRTNEREEEGEEVNIPSFSEGEEEIDEALSRKVQEQKSEEKPRERAEDEEAEVLPRTGTASAMDEIDFEMMRRVLQLAEDRRRPILLQLLHDHVWYEKVIRRLGAYALLHIFMTFGDVITPRELEDMLQSPDRAASILKKFLDEVFELFRRGGDDIKRLAVEARAVKAAYDVLITVGHALLVEVERLVALATAQIGELRQKLAVALDLMDSDQRIEYIRRVKELGLSIDEVVQALGEHVRPTSLSPTRVHALLEKLRESLSEIGGSGGA